MKGNMKSLMKIKNHLEFCYKENPMLQNVILFVSKLNVTIINCI